MNTFETTIRYAGLWLRLVALVIDLLPLCLLGVGLNLLYLLYPVRLAEVYAFPLVLLLTFWYYIYLVYRYGGTPGKLLLGLRIVRSDGSRIGLSNAVPREMLKFLLHIVFRAGIVVALLRIEDGQYTELLTQATHANERYRALIQFVPEWIWWTAIAQILWFASDLLVLLGNRKRRALHDFIARTVVIHPLPSQS